MPGNGVLFAGEKGILCSDCWGVGGVVKLKGDAKCRGVQDHEACKPVPVTLPRAPATPGEWLRACKGGPKTFQGFETAAMVAEIAMVGMLAMRYKPGVNTFSTIEWDSEALKVKGEPEADAVVHLPDAAEVAVRRRQKTTVSQQNSWVRSGRYAREVQHPAARDVRLLPGRTGNREEELYFLGKSILPLLCSDFSGARKRLMFPDVISWGFRHFPPFAAQNWPTNLPRSQNLPDVSVGRIANPSANRGRISNPSYGTLPIRIQVRDRD